MAATDDSPMPVPATAAQAGTAHARAASGISAASATAIRARPAAIRRCATSRGEPARWPVRRCTAAASVEPAITARLNGSSVAAASNGVRRRESCRYRVTSVRTELVVAVLSRAPSVPSRSGRDRISSRGSNGAAARRSASTKPPASAAQAASSRAPVTRPSGWVITVAPTTKAITAAVKISDAARFSDSACRARPRPGAPRPR